MQIPEKSKTMVRPFSLITLKHIAKYILLLYLSTGVSWTLFRFSVAIQPMAQRDKKSTDTHGLTQIEQNFQKITQSVKIWCNQVALICGLH